MDEIRQKNHFQYFNNINSHYTHGTVLIIQKNGRGFVTLYCFYDEKAIKKLDTYMAAIEGTLKYRDSEPELKKYVVNEDIVRMCIGVYRQKSAYNYFFHR